MVSIAFGAHDQTLTLFVFGVDSFIQCISGLGIVAMVLLAASVLYQFTGLGYVDSLGALGLIYFAVQEGRESFAKARGIDNCASD